MNEEKWKIPIRKIIDLSLKANENLKLKMNRITSDEMFCKEFIKRG